MLEHPREMAAALETVWASVADVCADLTPEEWATPTDCDGWSVKDQVSHIVWGIRMQRGVVPEPFDVPALPHLTDDVKRYMEIEVARRRDRSGADVLAELVHEAAVGAKFFESLADDDWTADAPGPMGSTLPRPAFLAVQVFDQYAHEQDIRRALGRPGHTAGPAAEHSRDRVALGWAISLPQRIAFDEATPVQVTVTGDVATTFHLDLAAKAPPADGPHPDPDVALRMDFETMLMLGCGRRPAEAWSRVTVEGDDVVASDLADLLTLTP